MSKRVVAVVVCSALFASACAEHATLVGPGPGAPVAARMRAYHHLRPREQDTLTTVTVSNNSVNVSQSTSLILGDGTTVELAEDLIPVVPPDSSTARAARESASARSSARVWYLVALAAVIGGTGLMIASIPTAGSGTGLGNTFWIGAGVGLVGSTVGYIGGAINARHAYREQRSAFATYHESLLDSLGLCVDQLKVVDCAARAPGAAPPSETPPSEE